VTSLLGTIRIERAYYHCKSCRRGTCPGDGVLGLTAADTTPGALEIVTMAGVLGGFAEAATVVLRRMSGLRLSESTVQRLTEAVGTDVGHRLNDGQTFGPETPWDWHKDAEGKTCAYLSIDATGVPQQGPHGEAAESKMATVAMIYNPVPDDKTRWAKPTATRRPAWQSRYVVNQFGAAGLAGPARRQAAQVGMGQAQRWIALSDGGAGLEDWLRAHFDRVEAVILDFYHAGEYLRELAKACHGIAAKEAEDQHLTWAHRLKHEGGQAMLEELKSLTVRESAKSTWRATVVYFENQVHRMDYPTYVAHGWQIGSGPVEAACKTVVGHRLKASGMRWRTAGSSGVCHARALYLSGFPQWTAYWTSRQMTA
jgi:hypothetical protein